MPVAKPKPAPFAPHWRTTDGETVRLYLGNVTDVLARPALSHLVPAVGGGNGKPVTKGTSLLGGGGR